MSASFDDALKRALGLSEPDAEPSRTGFDALNQAFQQTFGRSLTVTGTMKNNPFHKSPAQRDVRSRDLPDEQRRWVNLMAPRYGLRVRDFSSLKGPKRLPSGVVLSGPHMHLEPLNYRRQQTKQGKADPFDDALRRVLNEVPEPQSQPQSMMPEAEPAETPLGPLQDYTPEEVSLMQQEEQVGQMAMQIPKLIAASIPPVTSQHVPLREPEFATSIEPGRQEAIQGQQERQPTENAVTINLGDYADKGVAPPPEEVSRRIWQSLGLDDAAAEYYARLKGKKSAAEAFYASAGDKPPEEGMRYWLEEAKRNPGGFVAIPGLQPGAIDEIKQFAKNWAQNEEAYSQDLQQRLHLERLAGLAPEQKQQAVEEITAKRALTEEEAKVLGHEPGILRQTGADIVAGAAGAMGRTIQGLGMESLGPLGELGVQALPQGAQKEIRAGQEAVSGVGKTMAEGGERIGRQYGAQGLRGDVGRGVGQAIPTVAASVLAPGSTLGRVAPGIMGWLQNEADIHDEALRAGATKEQAKLAGTLAGPAGLLEMFGVGGTAGRAAREVFAKALISKVLREAGEEGGQEAVQGVINNLIAKGIYDPKRGVFEKVDYNALVGMITGGVAGTAIHGVTTAAEKGAENAQVREGQLSGTEGTPRQGDVQGNVQGRDVEEAPEPPIKRAVPGYGAEAAEGKVSDATQTREVAEGRQPEREGVGSQRTPTEAGRSDRIEPGTEIRREDTAKREIAYGQATIPEAVRGEAAPRAQGQEAAETQAQEKGLEPYRPPRPEDTLQYVPRSVQEYQQRRGERRQSDLGPPVGVTERRTGERRGMPTETPSVVPPAEAKEPWQQSAKEFLGRIDRVDRSAANWNEEEFQLSKPKYKQEGGVIHKSKDINFGYLFGEPNADKVPAHYEYSIGRGTGKDEGRFFLLAELVTNDGRRQKQGAVGEYAGTGSGVYASHRGKGAGAAFFKELMKRGEFSPELLGFSPGGLATVKSAHKSLIQDALNEGKPVPPEVLADYPDLKPPTEAPKAAEPLHIQQRNQILQRLGATPTAPEAPRVSAWKPQRRTLFVSGEGTNMMRQALAEIDPRTPTKIAGVTLRPEMLYPVSKALRKQGTPEAIAMADQLVMAMNQAPSKPLVLANAGRDLGLVRGTLRHERGHVRQKPVDYASVTGPEFAKAVEGLKARGYDAADTPQMVREATAHLLGGQWDQIGLTREEGAKILESYFKAVNTAYGKEEVGAYDIHPAYREIRDVIAGRRKAAPELGAAVSSGEGGTIQGGVRQPVSTRQPSGARDIEFEHGPEPSQLQQSPREQQERAFLRDIVTLDNRIPDPRWEQARPIPGVYEGYAREVDQPNLRALLPDGITTVYHETSLTAARHLVPRLEAGPRNHMPFYVSDNPDLALGQSGRGYLLEFDPARVNGRQNRQKAGLAFSQAQGLGSEYTVDKTVRGALRAITVPNTRGLIALQRIRGLDRVFDFANPTQTERGLRVQRIERRLTGQFERGPEPSQQDLTDLIQTYFDEGVTDLKTVKQRIRADLGNVKVGDPSLNRAFLAAKGQPTASQPVPQAAPPSTTAPSGAQPPAQPPRGGGPPQQPPAGGTPSGGYQPPSPRLQFIQRTRRQAASPVRSLMDRIEAMPTDIIRKYYDQFVDIRRGVKEAKKERGVQIPTEQDPGIITDLVYGGTGGRVEAAILDYSDVMKDAKKAKLADPLRDWLDLKGYDRAIRIIEEKEAAARAAGDAKQADAYRFKLDNKMVAPAGYGHQEITTDLQNIEAQLGPQKAADLKALADRTWDLNQQAWDMAHASGIISDAVYNQGLSRGKEYIPLERIMDIAESTGVQTALSLRQQKLLKRLEGSVRVNKDPFIASIERHAETIREAGRNEAAKSVANLRNLDPQGFGQVIRELPSGAKIPDGMGTIAYYEGGEKKVFTIPHEIADAMALANAREMGILGNALTRVTANMFRTGATTGNLAFSVPNVLRDLSDMFVLSKARPRNPVDFGRFLGQWIKNAVDVGLLKSPDYREFLRSRAAFSTLQKQIDPQAFQEIPGQKSVFAKLNAPGMVIDSIKKFNNVLEEATKMTAYRRLRQQGYSEEAAAIETRRFGGSPDFARRGTHSSELNLLMMFFNAQLQGVGRTFSRAKEHPRMLIAPVVGLTAAAIALNRWNSQFSNPDDKDKEIDHISKTDRQNYWVLILPQTYQTSDGTIRHRYLKFPKGHAVKLIANPVESALDAGFGGKVDVPQQALDTISQIMPGSVQLKKEDIPGSIGRGIVSSLNPIVKEPVEQLANQDMYRNIPIVPGSMEDIAPTEQRTPGTSPAAVKAGEALGVSPLRVEHAVRGFGAGVGEQVLNVADIAAGKKARVAEGDEKLTRLPVVGPLVRRFVGSGTDQKQIEREEKFYKAYKQAKEASDTFDRVVDTDPDRAAKFASKPENAKAYGDLARYSEGARALSEMRKQRNAIADDPNLTPAQKKERIRKLVQERKDIYTSPESKLNDFNANVRLETLKALSELVKQNAYRRLSRDQQDKAREMLRRAFTAMKARSAMDVATGKMELKQSVRDLRQTITEILMESRMPQIAEPQ